MDSGENPVDDEILAIEAQNALETTGEKNTGELENIPSVEFYYGRVRQNGKWIKTGKIYWIYTIYQNGKRRRISPSKIYRNEKRVTSIENCPYAGRIYEFRTRSLSFKFTGGTGLDEGLQDDQGTFAEELASQQ